MPCHVLYSGRKNAVKEFLRTKIEIEMVMYDEFGSVLGFINNQDDYSIKADLLNRDGMTILSSKTFFLYERPSDIELAEEAGHELVTGNSDDVLQAAQDWLTNTYRGEVHNNGWEQEVYEAGGLTNYNS